MVHSVVEAVLSYAERQPEKLCLVDDNATVTYREYAAMIRRLAAVLSAKGVAAGDRVVVEASQRIGYLALGLGVQLLGGVFVPVEHNCSLEKMKGFARKSGAKGLITMKPCEADTAFCATLDEVLSDADAAVPYRETAYPAPDALSSILFSTGTTGAEKGISLSNDNDIALCENVINGVGMLEDNTEFILSPFNHSHGLRRYYANMYRGASVVMMESVFNVKRLFRCIEEYRVNSMDLVPAALAVILRLTGDKLGAYTDQLRYLQFGGAAIPQENKSRLKELLPHTRLINIYGSTESGISCLYDFNTPQEKENCIGKPTVNADIFFVDENKDPIPADRSRPGFIACRGRINMLGYWEDAAETAKVLRDGVVYSNDMAYPDEDGDIILLGRKGDVINIGGKKVAPTEIEDAARSIPGVADCGCIGIPHKEKGSVPKLFVQMTSGQEFVANEIRAQLASKLEPYKVPEIIVPISKIPRTYKGSLQRNLLQDL